MTHHTGSDEGRGDLDDVLASCLTGGEVNAAHAGHAAGLTARAAAPDVLRERVEALTYASDDGTEYEHNGHAPHEGEPECPGCWAASIRAALAYPTGGATP